LKLKLNVLPAFRTMMSHSFWHHLHILFLYILIFP